VTYRVGNHQPQNIYRDDQYIGVMFTPEDAALVVEALNGHEPTCGHCGGPLRGYGNVHGVKVCHPDDGLDCYALVTLAGHDMPCETLDADRRYCEAVDDFFDHLGGKP
jgi:hypothetical protein